MNKTFVIGDIHGAYRAMIQCLERSSFDYEKDWLICLGDVCDGWPEVKLCIDELLKIKNLVYLMGNHDRWALEWFLCGNLPEIWFSQGGRSTIQSYQGKIPEEHKMFLKNAKCFHLYNNKFFVHGGFDPGQDPEKQSKKTFLWDRELVKKAFHAAKQGVEKITVFDEVYVGHTPTLNFGTIDPIFACEIILMDTGAGWPGGVLTMMDCNSKEIFRSDSVDSLYPGFSSRG
jgi:serine/threonine protein phosphatase 1